jgi:hypothetical protein
MIKIIHNNLIIDLCPKERYLKYLPHQQRFIEVKKYMANAVLSSDNNTVYHLIGTPYNFPNEIKTVQAYEIGQEEFERLQATTMLQNSKETIDLKREVDGLKVLVAQQNTLIQQLLEKLS